ncbi:MAG: aspartyl protease family protein, partial [Candidatus Thiodiazotropha endolucinida]|nr:aspartyl protease family protein [Candidatus Thiodiazotropha taylori]MCW4341870.1 aspartyl protease family protein [Candidatus Thiodiazotropha endolucinida]
MSGGVKQDWDESGGHGPYPERRGPRQGPAVVKTTGCERRDAGIQATTDGSLSHGSITSDSSAGMPQHCGVTATSEKNPAKNKDPVAETKTPVKVCMLKSVSKFTVPVRVGDVNIEAVVDSAAEVTIISDKIYESMTVPPGKLYDVRLDTAGRQMSIDGFVAGPIKMKIGGSHYDGPICVAPIEQDMLFGVDIMKTGSAVIDMGRGIFTFKGHDITMNVGKEDGAPRVARVSVAKRMVIPPNSAAQVRCKMDQSMPDYVIEPTQTEKVYGPRVVRSAGTDPVVCIVNCSDRYKLLRKGKEIASASPVEEYLPEEEFEEEADAEVCEVSQASVQKETDATSVPDHLKETFSESTQHLSTDQQTRLAALLNEFGDVFAKDEFDLGTFTEIEHGIDTGASAPIKQRMRRTPACFVGEEEAHLKKMIDTGVIQESTSERASTPV